MAWDAKDHPRDEENKFRSRPLMDRLMAKIAFDPFSGCWLWLGSISEKGYGSIGVPVDGKIKMRYTHCVTYREFIGPVPDGLELDHLCRVRSCCNPHHCEPVTHQENCRRGLGGEPAGALKRGRTHCPKGHEYTPENTYRCHGNGRFCRQCSIERSRAQTQAKKRYS